MVTDPIQATPQPAPRCQKCGRQDETLRVAVFPFVFSLLVVTYRRSFAGLWCSRHRRGYLSLASLITAAAGWLGIPYGFFFTPATLFKLAQGGIPNDEINFRLLNSVAEQKISEGKVEVAIRCFEESLRFQDSPEVRQRLSRLYQQQIGREATSEIGRLKPFWVVPVLFLLSALIGLGIGAFDIGLLYLLSPLFASGGSIIAAILSWVPFVTLLFFGILAIRSLVGWATKQLRVASAPLALALSIVASLIGIYQVPEARALSGLVLGNFVTAYSFSPSDGIFAVRSYLAYGGIMQVLNELKFDGLAGIIYIVLVLAGAGLSLYASAMQAKQSANWQARLAQVASFEDVSSNSTWLAFVGLTSFFLFIMLVLSGGKFVNVGEAFIHLNSGRAALDSQDVEAGLREYRALTEIWPDSVMGHTNLGIAYLSMDEYDLALDEMKFAFQRDPKSFVVNFFLALTHEARGEYEKAAENFIATSDAQPAWGLPHAYLAITYYQLDELEDCQAEIEKALELGAGDPQTNWAVSIYYAGIRDYSNAEKYIKKAIELTNDPAYRLLLARVYISQSKTDLAEELLGQIDEKTMSQVQLGLAYADLAIVQLDLEGAEAELLKLVELFPPNSQVSSDLSFVYFNLGRVEDAVAQAEQALDTNPYNGSAYVERAFAYHAQGKIAEAMESAKRGVELGPKYDRAHYILGLCYMDSGMNAEAIKEFELFLKLYYDRPYASQYKQKAEEFLARLK